MAKGEVEEKERWNDEGHFRIGFKCLMNEVSQTHIKYLAKPDKPVITFVTEHGQPRTEDNDNHSDDKILQDGRHRTTNKKQPVHFWM